MKYAAPLVNLAILETLKTSDYHDEIDLFIPYVAISIKNLPKIPFLASELQNQLLTDFGINAPSAAMDILLARAKRRELVRIENHAYFPISENVSAWMDQYQSRSKEVEESIDLVTDEFVIFSKEKFQKEISKDDALSLLYKFLRENIGDSALLAYGNRASDIKNIQNEGHLTASFIAYVHKARKTLWPYFEMITRGVMLAGYLTYADQISSKRNYADFSVYFDTPIILGLLGYSGESKANTLLEMLKMLLQHGVAVWVFNETQREIEGILSAWSTDLLAKKYDRFNPKTLELLKHRGIDSAAIDTRIKLLEKDIEALGIKVKLGFKWDSKYNCDVGALEEKIRNEFTKKSFDPRHDADVISKIHNSRRGQVIKSLDQKFSMFITPNVALIDISKEFFKIEGRCIPYAATEKWISTMFWFKHPEIFKGLPEKILVTSAYGTMFSDNGFWKKFASRLELLKEQREISEDDFILVRYDSDLLLKVHDISIDKGMNFSDQDIFDVVESIKEKLLKEKDDNFEKFRKESSEAIEESILERDKSDGRYQKIASKIETSINILSAVIGWFVFIFLVSTIVIVAYYSTPKEIVSSKFGEEIATKGVYAGIFLLTLVVDFVGKIFGLTIHNIRLWARNLVKKWLSNKLLD